MPLEIDHTVLDSGVRILALSGSMTMGNLLLKFEWTLQEMVKQQQNRIVVDMSQISYIDSSGVGVLVSCHGLVKHSGGQLRIAAVTDRVAKILKMAGVDALLFIDPTRDAAVAALVSMADIPAAGPA